MTQLPYELPAPQGGGLTRGATGSAPKLFLNVSLLLLPLILPSLHQK